MILNLGKCDHCKRPAVVYDGCDTKPKRYCAEHWRRELDKVARVRVPDGNGKRRRPSRVRGR